MQSAGILTYDRKTLLWQEIGSLSLAFSASAAPGCTHAVMIAKHQQSMAAACSCYAASIVQTPECMFGMGFSGRLLNTRAASDGWQHVAAVNYPALTALRFFAASLHLTTPSCDIRTMNV